MHRILIINSIVCVIGCVLGLLGALGSAISIANMKVPWSGPLLVAAMALPVTFVVSGVGAGLAHSRGFPKVAWGLMALPWVYGFIFVCCMLLAFRYEA